MQSTKFKYLFYLNSFLRNNLHNKQFRYCSVLKNAEESLKENENIKNFTKGPGLSHFLANANNSVLDHQSLSKRQIAKISHPYVNIEDVSGRGQKVFFKVYGCQMNVSDADIAWSILKANDYELTESISEANVILIVTCSIRENAEAKIWRQLKGLRKLKNENKVKVGILGCMAERLGDDFFKREPAVDVVAGPDSYKDLPRLLAIAQNDERTANILLSHDETYADINPVSITSSKSAFVSIMRGCDNMCTYCIVPFTRGRERSRPIESIVNEVKMLSDQGIKEVTLLGQNVNSYRDTSENHYATDETVPYAKGFKTIYKNKIGGRRFADLLEKVSDINPEMRFRFTSPHPKDFPDEVLHIIKERANICNHLHLPAQCGSSKILELMQRGYTRESYLELVENIKSILPDVAIWSDFICGFCGETEQDFADTLSLIEKVEYNFCFVFPYSKREKTLAFRKLEDDVPQKVKIERLERLSTTFRNIAYQKNLSKIGEKQLILVEGTSKRSQSDLAGRNDNNTKVIFPQVELPVNGSSEMREASAGDYVEVEVGGATSQVLLATPLRISSVTQFDQDYNERSQPKVAAL